MLNRSTSSFGDLRKINGKTYQLIAKFDMITQRDKERFANAREQYKKEYTSVRTVSNVYGEKALYVLGEEE